MLAAVARGRHDLVIERVALPSPGPGEVRVRVEACGLCGTDLHLRETGFAPGHVPGHEIAGSVDALGPGVSGLAVGDAVAFASDKKAGAVKVPVVPDREPTLA